MLSAYGNINRIKARVTDTAVKFEHNNGLVAMTTAPLCKITINAANPLQRGYHAHTQNNFTILAKQVLSS